MRPRGMMLRAVPLLLILTTVACAAPSSPASGPSGPAASSGPAPSGAPKTLTVGIAGNVTAFANMGSSTTAGGWQSLNELHSAGLITSDRTVYQPVARIASQVPSLDNGQLQVLPDGTMTSTYALRHDVTWQDGTRSEE